MPTTLPSNVSSKPLASPGTSKPSANSASTIIQIAIFGIILLAITLILGFLILSHIK